VAKIIDSWTNEAKVEEAEKRKKEAEKKTKSAQEDIEACHKDLNSKIGPPLFSFFFLLVSLLLLLLLIPLFLLVRAEKINKDVNLLQQSQTELKTKLATAEIEKAKLSNLLKERFDNSEQASKILSIVHDDALKDALAAIPQDLVVLTTLPPLPPLRNILGVGEVPQTPILGLPPGAGIPMTPIVGGMPPPPPPGMGGGPPPPPPPPPGTGGGPPPPPPPPGMGGGPPPPPPPGPGGPGGPPPPPGPGGFAAVPVGPPEKPKKISKGNLKPFMWTKLKNHTIVDTIWKDLDDKKFLERIEPEKEELEVLFVAAQTSLLLALSSFFGKVAQLSFPFFLPSVDEGAAAPAAQEAVQPVQITLVEPRRAQNCST